MNKSRHLDSLVWIRGWAAFFVIVSHILRATEQTYNVNEASVSPIIYNFFDLGTFGVLLFFTLSGTTLYLSYSNSSSFKLSGFYIKRFFRIWPAFAISLFAYVVFSELFQMFYVQPKGNWIETQFLSAFSGFDLASYLSLSFNINGTSGLFNNAYWSLPVEFQYYLIFPVLVVFLKWFGHLGPFLVAVIAYLLFRFDFHGFQDNKVFMLAFTFCGGVSIGSLFKSTNFKINKPLAYSSILLLLVVVSFISNGYLVLPDIPIISNVWIVLGTAAVAMVSIILFSDVSLPRPVLKFFVNYGEISYSVYLYHNLLIGLGVLCIVNFSINDAWLRLITVTFFGAVLSFYIANLSYKYIELPFIGFGRKLDNKLNGLKPQKTAQTK